MSETLAKRLKVARTAMHPKVLQRDVAKRFNVTPGAVCLWEQGSTEPNTQVLADLARLYGVSIDWLLGLDSERAAKMLPLNTVPVVNPRSLIEWQWSAALELLQTSVAYPQGTAAAILVSSDALSSTCPSGCYAVISKSHQPQAGSIVLASTGKVSEPVLRRFTEGLLIADDARWPTLSAQATKIIGCVVEVTVRRRLI